MKRWKQRDLNVLVMNVCKWFDECYYRYKIIFLINIIIILQFYLYDWS